MAEPLTLEFETENFRRWTDDLLRGMEKRAAGQALRTIAFEFINRVIKKTPVDEGRARGGWMSYLLAHGLPGSTGGSNPKAIAEGIAASSFRQNLNGSDQFIILVNAVNYIIMLEYGHSSQAPAGMMRLTFRELQAGETLTEELRKELVKEIAATNRKHPPRPVRA